MSDTQKSSSEPTPDPWGNLTHLNCRVTAELQIPDITVGDILRVEPGTVLNTRWRINRDLPLRVNGRLMALAEFESAGEKMGIRVTEFTWEQQQ